MMSLRPGILVHLTARVSDTGLSYQRVDIETDEIRAIRETAQKARDMWAEERASVRKSADVTADDWATARAELGSEASDTKVRAKAKQIAGNRAVESWEASNPAPIVPAVTKWETTRVCEDQAEHDEAMRMRGTIRANVSRNCSSSVFGLFCLESNVDALKAAIAEARTMCDEWNRKANFTHIRLFVEMGRIATTDEEHAREIAREIASVIDRMNSSIDNLDPKGLEDTIREARGLAARIDAAAAEKVGVAVAAARDAAKQITARVIKGGEPAVDVLADIQRSALIQTRAAFLDFDGPADVQEVMPAADLNRAANLDVDGMWETPADVPPSPPVQHPALDLEQSDPSSVRYSYELPALDL